MRVIYRLVEDDAGAEMALEDGSRRLAGPEPGDRGAGEGADGGIDGAVEALSGSSIWSWTVDLAAGVRVICIEREV